MWRLHEPTTAFGRGLQQYVGLSRSGTRIATAHKWEKTVTITDLTAQTPPQFIDTDVEIGGLILTGNVLLLSAFDKLIAWLLTEEGLVDGTIGDGRVGRDDSIWIVSKRYYESWKFRVEGHIGIIELDEKALHVYHTETGEVLHPAQAPQYHSDRWCHLYDPLWDQDHRCHHNTSQCNTLPEGSWQTSLREGWVKDSEGKYRLWVPAEWREDWDPADWRQDVMIQFSVLGGRLVLIKF